MIGVMVILRVIRKSGANDFLKLCKEIDAETKIMMFESDGLATPVDL